MKKFVFLLFVWLVYGCSVTEQDSLLDLSRSNSPLLIETRSSIKIDELPDNYNVSLSSAELVANIYSSGKMLQELIPFEYEGYTLFYVANYDKGYKVISGDKRTSIFLLESDEGKFEFKDDDKFSGPHLWLNDLASDILRLKKGEAIITDTSNVLFWSSIIGEDNLHLPQELLLMSNLDSIDFDDPEHIWAIVPVSENDYYYNQETVPHILTTKWGQQLPWNTYVPYKGDGNMIDPHCPTGCSAVAMAQVIYYCHYNLNKPAWLYHDAQATGTYNDPNDPISYSAGTYNAISNRWDYMAPSIDSLVYSNGYSADFVGHLMADVGHRININYAPDGSGAFVSKSGFNEYEIYCDSSYYNSSTVISNLLSNNPVVITAYAERSWSLWDGYSYDIGHTWVIDGLESVIRDHVITYEWRRLSELDSNNYPLYTEEQMMLIDPYVYSGKTFQETTRYSQYYFKMNWGYDGIGDQVSYGINSSEIWEYDNTGYQYNKQIWYAFR